MAKKKTAAEAAVRKYRAKAHEKRNKMLKAAGFTQQNVPLPTGFSRKVTAVAALKGKSTIDLWGEIAAWFEKQYIK